jgi:hypothetical protein
MTNKMLGRSVWSRRRRRSRRPVVLLAAVPSGMSDNKRVKDFKQ